VTKVLDVFWPPGRAQHDSRGITRGQVDDEEDEHCDAEDHRDERKEPP
jgi:hypothetical protein